MRPWKLKPAHGLLEVAGCRSNAAFGNHLVYGVPQDRDESCHGMAMVGDLQPFTCRDSSK
jgi:hypothetical protein